MAEAKQTQCQYQVEVDNMITHMKKKFGGTYEECLEDPTSDRKLFITTFDMLLVALQEQLELNVKSELLKMTFSDMYQRELAYLEELKRNV